MPLKIGRSESRYSMAKIEYVEEGLYRVKIDTDVGTVSLGGETFINDDKSKAYLFQVAYLLGREHKKSQITKALGL